MSDTPPTDAASGPQQPAQQFDIQKIYLKDLSFESPLAPGLFLQEQPWRPEVNMQLNAESETHGEDQYEVVLTLTVTASVAQQTAFLIELKQAGLFRIGGFERPALGHMLGSYCPNLLFPFAREAVADLVGKGGLPQLLLAPINFDALYAQHLEKLRDGTPAAASAPEQ